jgi:hypothetical protein
MSKSVFFIIYSALVILIFLSFATFGHENTLRTLWNTPTMYPFFADIRTITGVNESLSYGLDPLVSNPGDPWNRVMNYPRIWQYLAQFLNLNQSHGIYFGFINITLFILGFIILISKIELSKTSAIIFLFGFFSPSTILGMERGNIDLIIFFILSMSLLFITNKIIYPLFILFASILKIFPIFTLICLIKFERNQFIKILFFSLTAFIFYFLFTLQDIKLINDGTPKSSILTYGIKTIPNAFNLNLSTYFYVSILLSVFIYCFLKIRSQTNLVLNTKYIDAFRIGSVIYVMTFIIGINWDYRLIFLLFSVPQLTIWLKSESFLIRSSSLISILTMILTMWFLDIKLIFNHRIFSFDEVWLVDEISNWILFFNLLLLLTISLPKWILKLKFRDSI